MKPSILFTAGLFVAGCSAPPKPSLSLPVVAQGPERTAIAFLARAGEDSRVELTTDLGLLARGDGLEYDLYVASAAPVIAGVELAFDDGSVLAPPRAAAEAWSRQSIALDRFAGKKITSLRLAALDTDEAPAIFVVDNITLVRGTGAREEVFRDALPLGPDRPNQDRIDDPEGRAACVAVGVRPGYPQTWIAAEGAIVDPWFPIDIGRAEGEHSPYFSDGEVGRLAAEPHGSVFLDAAIPFDFSIAGEERGVLLGGQSIAFSPVDGGRYYELHLALEGAPFTTSTWTILGRDGDTRPLSITLPRRERGAERSFVTLSVPIAASFAIDGVRAPDDPSLRLLAATVRWHKDGPVGHRFLRTWIAREAPSDDVVRWMRDLEFGAGIVSLEDEAPYERRLFDLLITGDGDGFRELLDQRLAHFAALGEESQGDRITFVPTFDLASAGADEVESLLALLESRPDLTCTVRSASACAALARREPALFARLRDHARSGRVELAAARWSSGRAEVSHGRTLVRDIVLGLRWAHENGFRVVLGDLAGGATCVRVLPQLWRAAGVGGLVDDVGDPDHADDPDEMVANARPRVFRALADDGSLTPTIALIQADERTPETDLLGRALAKVRAQTGAGELAVAIPLEGRPRDLRRLAAIENLSLTDLAPEIRIGTIGQHLFELTARKDAHLPVAEPTREPPKVAVGATGSRALERAVVAELDRAERFGAIAEADGLSWMRAEARELVRRFVEALDRGDDHVGTAAAELRSILARAGTLVQDELAVLARSARTSGPGQPIVVFNPLPWDRVELVEVESDANGVLDADLQPLTVQKTAAKTLLFRADVPSMGYAVFHLVSDAVSEDATTDLRVEGTTISNARIACAIDPDTGQWRSLRLVPESEDLLVTGNVLSWSGPDDAPIALALHALERIEVLECGPLRAVVRVTRAMDGARIVEEIALVTESAEIDVRTRIEGLSDTGELRTNFVLRHPGAVATSDLPFATATTPAYPGDPSAAFAFSSWAERGDDKAAVALTSRSCASFGASNNLLALALAGTNDGGGGEPVIRDVDYALIARGGGDRASAAARAAEERAHPLIVQHATAHDGARPARHAFLTIIRIDAEGQASAGAAADLELTALLPADDGAGWIVRLRETRGAACTAQLVFDRNVFSAQRTNLLEEPLGNLEVDRRRVRVRLEPHTIETLRVRVRP